MAHYQPIRISGETVVFLGRFVVVLPPELRCGATARQQLEQAIRQAVEDRRMVQHLLGASCQICGGAVELEE